MTFSLLKGNYSERLLQYFNLLLYILYFIIKIQIKNLLKQIPFEDN